MCERCLACGPIRRTKDIAIQFWNRLSSIVSAAESTALCDWGTSVSEHYHNIRVRHMEQLREALNAEPLES